MLRVPQNHPGRKQRGRGCCAISSLPTPSSFASASLFRMLSPTVPVHPRNAPVSPIIPVHTQKQGGVGGVFCKMCSPITLLFSAALLTRQLSAIVGAPTFPFPHNFRRSLGRGASSAIRKRALKIAHPSKLGAGANREIGGPGCRGRGTQDPGTDAVPGAPGYFDLSGSA